MRFQNEIEGDLKAKYDVFQFETLQKISEQLQ